MQASTAAMALKADESERVSGQTRASSRPRLTEALRLIFLLRTPSVSTYLPTNLHSYLPTYLSTYVPNYLLEDYFFLTTTKLYFFIQKKKGLCRPQLALS